MEENKTDIVKKPKKKLSSAAIVLIIGLVIIAIPCIVFGVIILSATLKTGTPVLGERFKNDLTYSISEENIATIKADINSLSNIESVEIDDPDTGRLTVMVDVDDSCSQTETLAIAESVYEKVIKTLPISEYFSQTDSARNYDLTIYVYTSSTSDSSRILYTVTYNSQMNLPSYELNSSPKDEETAKAVRGETEEEDTTEETQEEESE